MFKICFTLSVVGIVVALPSIAPADHKDKVCAPIQWSAHMYGETFSQDNVTPVINDVRARHYVDYSANIEAFQREFTIKGETSTIHYIADFNEMRIYELDLNKRSCTIKDIPMDGKLKRFCEGDRKHSDRFDASYILFLLNLPTLIHSYLKVYNTCICISLPPVSLPPLLYLLTADLKLIKSITIGGKMADIYEVIFQNEKTRMTVMRGSFSPVTAVIPETTQQSAKVTAYQYGNVSAGIADSSVFRIPSHCLPPPQLNRVCIAEQFEVFSFSQVVDKYSIFDQKLHQARDFINKKEIAISFTDNDKKSATVTLFDWKNQTMYRIIPHLKQCVVSPLPVSEMLEMCSDSKHLKWRRSFSVDGKMADEYNMVFSDTLTATIRVFRDTFELISAINLSTYENNPMQWTPLQYGNMTQGIKDPAMFDIPDYCFTGA